MEFDRMFEHFRQSDGVVSADLGRGFEPVPGVWPLMDENRHLTPFVGIGTKEGVDWKAFERLKRCLSGDFKYFFNCQSGPFIVDQFNAVVREFNAFCGLDFMKSHPKHLDCNHSMMARSMPYKGFFWEPIVTQEIYDFGILTWGPSDSRCKRWDRAEKICEHLCSRGMRGWVVTQRDPPEALISRPLKRHVESGSLKVLKGELLEKEFHALVCASSIMIFPNAVDAFPKSIIESLLANRRVVISEDLLMGKGACRSLGEEHCLVSPFKTNLDFDVVYEFIRNKPRQSISRKNWLERYGIDALSVAWAGQFNKKFGTTYRRLFYFNHTDRLAATGLLS